MPASMIVRPWSARRGAAGVAGAAAGSLAWGTGGGTGASACGRSTTAGCGLDRAGTRPTGPLAPHYVLRRAQ
ncbi:hypothetical protein G6F24_015259 [Rhizopus arrhizus]|nr:hypothetical protein G6F24_015259 [Rhizopus arrhizus]